MRHEQPAGAGLGQFDRGGEERVDALAVRRDLRDLLPDGLVHLGAGLPGRRVREAEQQVGVTQVPLDKGEDAVAVQRGPDEGRGLDVLVEEDVLPRHDHVVEHDHGVDLVDAVGQRVVQGVAHAGET